VGKSGRKWKESLEVSVSLVRLSVRKYTSRPKATFWREVVKE
jgi:hypothetical protein